MRILIIEDEAKIVRVLEHALGAHGYQVLSADNGEDGVRLAATESVALVLLDIMMPGLDGHQTLARIRQERPDLPVLMLTALDDSRDKVDALDAGADDYVTKPFVLEELLARIRALTRRADQQRSSVLRVGELWMDVLGQRVRLGTMPVDLSRREFDLLERFMRHQGRVLSRRDLLSDIWGHDFERDTNLVDVYVGYLRRKIDAPGRPSWIKTVRGEGYVFEIPGTEGPGAASLATNERPPTVVSAWTRPERRRESG